MAGMISVGMSVFSDRACHTERVLMDLGGGLPGQTGKEQVLYQDQSPVEVSRTMELGTMRVEAHGIGNHGIRQLESEWGARVTGYGT